MSSSSTDYCKQLADDSKIPLEATPMQDGSANQYNNVLSSIFDQKQQQQPPLNGQSFARISSTASTKVGLIEIPEQYNRAPLIGRLISKSMETAASCASRTLEGSMLQQQQQQSNNINCNNDICVRSSNENTNSNFDCNDLKGISQMCSLSAKEKDCTKVDGKWIEDKQQTRSTQINQSAAGSLWSMLSNVPQQSQPTLNSKRTNPDSEISPNNSINNNSALSRGKTTVANLLGHFRRYPENLPIAVNTTTQQKQDHGTRYSQQLNDRSIENNPRKSHDSKIDGNDSWQNVQQTTSQSLIKAAQTEQANPSSIPASKSLDTMHQQTNESIAISLPTNRFVVRYLGSSILHRNFTLPMLEWIAKDIKRQTIKGAKITSQRQFTIPARDIVLEIQSFQLKGSSCKDGHCIFVHPMQHVSKYAQLQHDPNCFSYLIRDYKDSPYTCHVFQAKNVKKVHEIFTAVREATTRSRVENLSTKITPMMDNQNGSASPLIVGTKQEHNFVVPNQKSAADNSSKKDTSLLVDIKLIDLPKQFENSYQFEVMFVKKVKLQCRRVPSTFVDDAMETLKSFEVLKNTETKSSGLGKRIINASVDERQEYDESCSSPTSTGPTANITHPVQDSYNKSLHNSKANDIGIQKVNNNQKTDEQNLDEASEYGSSLNPSNIKFGSTCSLNIVPECSSQIEKLNISDDNRLCINKATLTQTLSMDSGSKQMLLEKLRDHDEENNNQKIQKSASQSIFASTLSGSYNNDFSPYNTITSIDVNNQIAAMPVMSSSVSLDHETRQKLARQIREKLMETASNLSSSKNSINRSNEKVSTRENNDDNSPSNAENTMPGRSLSGELISLNSMIDSAGEKVLDLKSPDQPHNKSNMSNFDLFRRASTRQVVKNRTMLLLIGKDELCTISTDHHQVLFNKSFNCIVHCLQGTKNNDHFGLICRDSGKINPNTESYAGFIFKCQSDKVVREVMAAMKQVIHNSHHNFYSYNSPYNPLNASSLGFKSSATTPTTSPGVNQNSSQPFVYTFDKKFAKSNNTDSKQNTSETTGEQLKNIQHRNRPNPIRSMFCDDCPLHWYHRLCCDLESMPPEASKAIILRRLDTSFSELEQDELLSKFSEFRIETVDEHNDIFMSLLRHLCEKKQSKHNQSQSHITALAIYNNKISDSVQHNEASPSAMDNLMKAKKSISASIENILKRRSSLAEDQDDSTNDILNKNSPTVYHNYQDVPLVDKTNKQNPMKHSGNTSSSDASGSPPKRQHNFGLSNISKINDDYNPLAGLFRRRSSTFGSSSTDLNSVHDDDKASCNSTDTSSWAPLRHASSETRLSPSNQSTDDSNQSQNNIAKKPPTSPTLSKCSSINPHSHRTQSNHNNSQDPGSSSLLTSTFWKKSIYEKIRSTVTTDHNTDRSSIKVEKKLPTSSPLVSLSTGNRSLIGRSIDKAPHKRRSSEEIRYLWKKAIDEQITLIKMDKQNKILQVQLKEKSSQEVKLNYKDSNVSKFTNSQWDKLLMQDPTMKVDFTTVSTLIRKGVSHNKRGEVWMFLMNQYQLRHGTTFHTSDREYSGDANQPYRNLLTQLSLQQHEIFVDLGRTFPNHPYYSQFLGAGQLSLFNLLKAYSLLDPQVGYCQGLSFVAGILLLHVNSEDEAFELMRHLLFNYGLRKQYLPSMNALQLQLYQLTRLLRDFEYEIFRHFDNLDISPSLYAAPWFLTLFASQFPLYFTARLFDLLFLHGIEAIFRISICLLSYHRDNIIKCHTLESTMKYIKTSLMSINSDVMAKIFDKSLEMDLRNNLIDYEIEYTFYCAQDSKSRSSSIGTNHLNRTINDSSKLDKSRIELSSSGDEAIATKIDEPSSVVATAAAAILQQLMMNDYTQAISISTQD